MFLLPAGLTLGWNMCLTLFGLDSGCFHLARPCAEHSENLQTELPGCHSRMSYCSEHATETALMVSCCVLQSLDVFGFARGINICAGVSNPKRCKVRTWQRETAKLVKLQLASKETTGTENMPSKSQRKW